jgi:hypothetical protein
MNGIKTLVVAAKRIVGKAVGKTPSQVGAAWFSRMSMPLQVKDPSIFTESEKPASTTTSTKTVRPEEKYESGRVEEQIRRMDEQQASANAAPSDVPLTDRLKETYNIAKEHVKAAAKNQGQAMEDTMVRGEPMSDAYKQHGKAAKEDMKQWGKETKEALKGERIPGDPANVRDLPPAREGGKVDDCVVSKPT